MLNQSISLCIETDCYWAAWNTAFLLLICSFSWLKINVFLTVQISVLDKLQAIELFESDVQIIKRKKLRVWINWRYRQSCATRCHYRNILKRSREWEGTFRQLGTKTEFILPKRIICKWLVSCHHIMILCHTFNARIIIAPELWVYMHTCCCGYICTLVVVNWLRLSQQLMTAVRSLLSIYGHI